MKRKQVKHSRVSKLGKVFQAGTNVSNTQQKLLGRLKKQAMKAANKMARKRTRPLSFSKGGRAAKARDLFAKYYAAKMGAQKPMGLHYAIASNRVKLLKGTPAQVKEVKARLAERFMASHKHNAKK